jgi:hypothetical protein
MPPSRKKFHSTLSGVSGWAMGELEHVGRIAAVEDPDLQYTYAKSTVDGMLHLRNAIYELINDNSYSRHFEDLNRLYGQVNRAVQHLITEYNIEKETIVNFNTRGVLGNVNNLQWKHNKTVRSGGRRRNRTRKN